MKSLIAGLLALGLSSGAAVAESWEAVAVSDYAVMAVDWTTLRINGTRRRVTVAAVKSRPEADSPFDYAASNIDLDCTSQRYLTIGSTFFYIDGSVASDPYRGDGQWTAIEQASLMADVHTTVCGSAASRTGFFDDLNDFAVNVRLVVASE